MHKILLAAVIKIVDAVKISGVAETCQLNIRRFEQGSTDYRAYTGTGHLYRDESFPASDSSLFWS